MGNYPFILPFSLDWQPGEEFSEADQVACDVTACNNNRHSQNTRRTSDMQPRRRIWMNCFEVNVLCNRRTLVPILRKRWVSVVDLP